MNKRTQQMLSNFTDREIRYILQYAQTHLEQSSAPRDGTVQGSILERIHSVIRESRK